MDNIYPGEMTADEALQTRQIIEQYIAEIEKRREQMRLVQVKIDASGARTDATLNRIQERLAQLQAS